MRSLFSGTWDTLSCWRIQVASGSCGMVWNVYSKRSACSSYLILLSQLPSPSIWWNLENILKISQYLARREHFIKLCEKPWCPLLHCKTALAHSQWIVLLLPVNQQLTPFLPHLWESRTGSLWALLYGSPGGWWSSAASSFPRWRRWADPASAGRSPRSRAGSLAQSGRRCGNRQECAAPQLFSRKGGNIWYVTMSRI